MLHFQLEADQIQSELKQKFQNICLDLVRPIAISQAPRGTDRLSTLHWQLHRNTDRLTFSRNKYIPFLRNTSTDRERHGIIRHSHIRVIALCSMSNYFWINFSQVALDQTKCQISKLFFLEVFHNRNVRFLRGARTCITWPWLRRRHEGNP